MPGDQVHVLSGLDGWCTRRRPSVAAVGTFDGVHLGHKALVRRAVESARAVGAEAVVVTFEPHPAEVVRGERGGRICTAAEKVAHLAELEPDAIVVVPFDEAFAALSTERFAAEVLAEGLAARQVHVGFNFRFGRGGGGSVDELGELGRAHGFSVHVLPSVEHDGEPISSTRIRGLLQQGDVAVARFLLGRAYRLAGVVAHGEGRGRGLGFPTANLAVDDERKLVPRFGVYRGRTGGDLPASACGDCLVSVGLSPTFGPREAARVEVFVPDFAGDLYGRAMVVELLEWVRPELRFSSAEALVAQMRDDVEFLRARTGRSAPVCRRS